MFKTKIQNIFSRGPGALCSFLQGGQKIEVTPLQTKILAECLLMYFNAAGAS